MFRGCDGADGVDTKGCLVKYIGSIVTFAQISMEAGVPGPPNSGANGQALWLFNTAFGECNFTRIFDAQQTWGWHGDFRILNSAGSTAQPAEFEWFQMGTATKPNKFAIVNKHDGTWDVIYYTPLNVKTLLQTTTALPVNVIKNVEIKVKFGRTGTWEIHLNGALFYKGNVDFGDTIFPDRLGARFQGFGPPGVYVDNQIWWDGQNNGDGFNDFLGPCRITTMFPNRDAVPGWSRNGAGTGFGAVSELPGNPPGAPDGDTTYLSPPVAGALNLFGMNKSPCFGRVLGVAVNMTARPTSGSPRLGAYFRNTGVSASLLGEVLLVLADALYSGGQAPLVGYATYQVFAGKNPETAKTWTDLQITNGLWGIGADNSIPNERVTHFYLEKITTLDTSKSFSCGGTPNYSTG